MEYAVMVAAVAAVIVVAVFLLGDVVHEVFTDTCDLMDTEADTSAEC